MYNWYYNEMQHVGTDYDNIQEIEDYDNRMSKFRDFDFEIETLLSTVKPAKDDVIVEFGSGTGIFAFELAKRCKKVIAVDISQKMLEYTENKARGKGISNIEYVHSGFLNYSHDGQPVDAIVTQLALHHLPDFWKNIAISRMADILRAGGQLFIKDVVFPTRKPDEYLELIDKTLTEFSKLADNNSTEGFENHIKNEYSTFDWALEEMFKNAGLKMIKKEDFEFFISSYLFKKI